MYDEIVRMHIEEGASKSQLAKRFRLTYTTISNLWKKGIPIFGLPPIKERVEGIIQKRLQEEEDRLVKALDVAGRGVVAWTLAMAKKASIVAGKIETDPDVVPTHIVGAELDRGIRLIKFLQGEADQKVEVDVGIPPPEEAAKLIRCLPPNYKKQLFEALGIPMQDSDVEEKSDE
jgi:hypothetical protein